jgi:hypothetical protein
VPLSYIVDVTMKVPIERLANGPWLCYKVSLWSKALTRGRSIAVVPSPNFCVEAEFASVQEGM